MGQRAADLAGPDQSNLLARHGSFLPLFETARLPAQRLRSFAGAIVLSLDAIKPNFWRKAENSLRTAR